MTLINIKLQVLDSCMFAAYLYGCKCWWKVEHVAESLLAEDREILRRVLQVKPNTPNDIIYIELNRCDIIINIKHKQKKVFQPIQNATARGFHFQKNFGFMFAF